MNSLTSDSRHDVPEVSAQDAWSEDTDAWPESESGGTILPPRRISPHPAATLPGQAAAVEGLRIEAGTPRPGDEEAGGGLELREIDGTVVRLDPEEPAQPKVARQVTFHPQAPGKRREIEVAEWGRAKSHSMKWIYLVGLAAVAMVIFALVAHPRLNRATATSAAPVAEESIPADAGELEKLINRQPEAERLFSKYISTPAVADILPLVRDRAAVEPLIRNAGHTPFAGRAPKLTACGWFVHEIQGAHFAVLGGTLPDFTDFRAYFVLTEGLLQIDWKATTGYGSATFEQLGHGAGNASEIRGTLSPAEYFSPVFPETEYRSYLLEGPEISAGAVWCYARRGEPAGRALAALFKGGEILASSQQPRRVTLRLKRGPAQALPNQWLVEAMLHEEWIQP